MGTPNGGLGGDVAANGNISWATASTIGGTVWTPVNLTASKTSTVKGDLHLGGTLSGSGTFTVNKNASVVKTLPTFAKVLGTTTKVSSVAAPCSCSSLVPTSSITASHKATSNDNATINLSSTAFVGANPTTLDLPCGNYYLTQINATKALTVNVHGHTALYVDGNVASTQAFTVQVDATATLDLFVAGTFSVQSLTLGSAAHPDNCRLYVAGNKFSTTGAATYGCNVYAPSAPITVASNAVVYGSLFGSTVTLNGNATVHYDTKVLSGASECCAAAGCNDNLTCTTEACTGNGTCSHAAVANGTTCSDSNSCTKTDTCQAGVCTGASPVVCTAADACHTVGTCDPANGTCSSPVAANGTTCSDGNACTKTDSCQAGVCTGASPVLCTASDACHVAGTCNAANGTCSNPTAANGTACSDGNACNGSESCTGGACTGGTAPPLNDSNPCTADSCDPATGVKHAPVAVGTTCSDGNVCNGAEQCNSTGTCVGGIAPVLDDGNPCTTDACDASSGVTHTALPLDDGNPCTVDACDASSGVTHRAVAAGTACDDQTICNGREVCNSSGSCLPGTPLTLDDHDPCTNDVCDAGLGVTHPTAANGASCSDGNACNGDERCNATGQCLPGTAPVVDDGNRCTTDSCDAATGAIRHDPLPGGSSCANSNLCDGAETCNGSGSCQAGVPPIVDDGNVCTTDSCDPLGGVKHVFTASGSCVAPARWDTLIASQPSPRDGAAGVFTNAGELFLFGGENAGTSLADTWLWSPAKNGWRRGASGPSARVGSGVAFDSQRQRVIVFGGVAGADADASYFGDIWEYSPTDDSWLSRPAAAQPPSRAMAAFAYDSNSQRALLFGGVGAAHLADTWAWDAAGGAWSQITGPGPSARFGAAFAFDPTHRVFVLFGGSPQGVTGGALNDTWTFSPATNQWSQLTPTAKPPARAGASMTFDASVSRLVMVGGTSVDALNVSDVWELDASGSTWAQLSASTAVAETAAVAGFDPVTNQLLAATGLNYSDSGRFSIDASAVWTYSRATQRWLARSATTAPARLDLGAAFDSSTGRVVTRATVNISDASTRPRMWDYDGASRQWQSTDASAAQTDFSSGAFRGDENVTNFLIYDSDRNLTLRVGSAATTSTGFGWVRIAEWNGEQWRAGCNVSATDATKYIGVDNGTAIYDPPRKRVLVFWLRSDSGAGPGNVRRHVDRSRRTSRNGLCVHRLGRGPRCVRDVRRSALP